MEGARLQESGRSGVQKAPWPAPGGRAWTQACVVHRMAVPRIRGQRVPLVAKRQHHAIRFFVGGWSMKCLSLYNDSSCSRMSRPSGMDATNSNP